MSELAAIILGFTLPCLMTTLGAVLVFFFRKISKLVDMLTIGLAAGIMLSASIWSLLVPALENAKEMYLDLAFLPVVFGFVLGAIFMVFLDFVANKIFKSQNSKKIKKTEKLQILSKKDVKNAQKSEKNQNSDENLNYDTSKKRAFKMFTAITIHNIPEGMSVGFAIGTAVALGSPLLSALMFAIGIALQNFPEGLATALPIYTSLQKKGKAFVLATLSGVVEPIFAVAGYFLAAQISSLLPWLLSFSAGAMIYVIIEEMVPEIKTDGSLWGIWAFVIGFVAMMLLDICL